MTAKCIDLLERSKRDPKLYIYIESVSLHSREDAIFCF